VISPFVGRLRLARELRELRKQANVTTTKLAVITGMSQPKVSRLESGQYRPDQGDIIRYLDGLGVPENGVRAKILSIAQQAAGRGWWESIPMDSRQAQYANLEAGAVTIREWQQNVIPGLLQTRAYTEALTTNDDLIVPDIDRAAPDDAVRARMERQRMLRMKDVTYEVIIDEIVIRRPSAPRPVLAEQLRHLADDGRQATVRVLPVDAEIDSYTIPRSPFSIYTFPDPDDPTVVAVDTVTEDLILTEKDEVAQYEQLFDRLRKAALSGEDSKALIRRAADEMEVS
jgi:transcriptional regulator with XRE-family HTH domain